MKLKMIGALGAVALLAACSQNPNHSQNEKETANPNPGSTSGAPAGMDTTQPSRENPGSAPTGASAPMPGETATPSNPTTPPSSNNTAGTSVNTNTQH